MKILKPIKSIKLSTSLKWLIGMLLFTAAGIALAAPIDASKDLLLTAKGNITTNFGASSTVAYIIYLIEIFAGVAAYIKTKNLFALVGIIVVIVFTSAAFSMIG